MSRLVIIDTVDPDSAPEFIGQWWLNTTTGNSWRATGTSSSSDFNQLGGGGGLKTIRVVVGTYGNNIDAVMTWNKGITNVIEAWSENNFMTHGISATDTAEAIGTFHVIADDMIITCGEFTGV